MWLVRGADEEEGCPESVGNALSVSTQRITSPSKTLSELSLLILVL